jgi:hypothetical protein
MPDVSLLTASDLITCECKKKAVFVKKFLLHSSNFEYYPLCVIAVLHILLP